MIKVILDETNLLKFGSPSYGHMGIDYILNPGTQTNCQYQTMATTWISKKLQQRKAYSNQSHLRKISRLSAHKSMQLSFEFYLVMQKPSMQKLKNQNLIPKTI